MNGVDIPKLTIGLKGSADLLVELASALRVRSGRVAVLATPAMINVMEAAALTIRCDSCCIAGVGLWPFATFRLCVTTRSLLG